MRDCCFDIVIIKLRRNFSQFHDISLRCAAAPQTQTTMCEKEQRPGYVRASYNSQNISVNCWELFRRESLTVISPPHAIYSTPSLSYKTLQRTTESLTTDSSLFCITEQIPISFFSSVLFLCVGLLQRQINALVSSHFVFHHHQLTEDVS